MLRGRYQSEGQWLERMTPHKDKKGPKGCGRKVTDTYDTIDWLLKKYSLQQRAKPASSGIPIRAFTPDGCHGRLPPGAKGCPRRRLRSPICYMNDDAYHNGAFMLDRPILVFLHRVSVRPRRAGVPAQGYGPEIRFSARTMAYGLLFCRSVPISNLKKKLSNRKLPIGTTRLAHPQLRRVLEIRAPSLLILKNVKWRGAPPVRRIVRRGRFSRSLSRFSIPCRKLDPDRRTA